MAPTPISWWTATSTTFKGILGFAGLALGISPLFSQGFSNILRDWWILGWALALAFFLFSAVLFVGARSRHKAASESSADPSAIAKAELKRNELIADLATIEEWFKPFMSKGKIRERLEWLPDPKYFSYELSKPFYQLGKDFNDTSKELFTPELIKAVAEAKTAYRAYWLELEPLLDAPDEIQGSNWDLKVMAPPDGGWNGDTTSQRWDSFYTFVRTLIPLMYDFLEKVSAIEKTAHRLKVQAGLNTP